jgi:hypothetical protein
MPTHALTQSRPKARNADAAPDRSSAHGLMAGRASAASLPLFLQGLATSGIQAKLLVNQPGDAFEHEADAVSEAAARDGDGARSAAPRGGARRPKTPLAPEPVVQSPDGGSALNRNVRARVEPLLGMDLSGVRVHDSSKARDAAGSIGARAFTHRNHIWLGPNESADDAKLLTHEAAHVLQQSNDGDGSGSPPAIQRQTAVSSSAPSVTPTGESTGEGDGANQSFGFSEDEMEARLSSTPPEGADASAPTVEVDASTESTLNEVENEAGGEGEGEGGAAAEGEESEGEGRGGEGVGERERGAGRARGGTRGGGGGGGGGAATTPGPATEFEGLVAENVGAYLEGNLSEERMAELDPRTQELLEAVDLLGDRSITDPEAAALSGLGEGLEPAAPSTGYEGEPLWLRTLATIRDITSQLGGIVGIIGLVATVSGFILSLLMPPVGAFLLTVGRFCDVAALILDAISLVLGIILTGYNLYRLKNETDPEERRRLLGMVRQDAMGTVMSAVSVATAVAPGAARLLGRSRVGRFAGRAIRAGGTRVAGAVTRVAATPGRLGRSLTTIGRVGAAGIAGARRLGAGVSGRFHTFFGRARDYGLRTALSTTLAGRAVRRFGATTIGRGIGRGLGYAGRGARWIARSTAGRAIGRAAAGGFGYARRGAQWLAQSRFGRWVAGSRLGRYAGRVYGENLDMARLLFARSESAHHTYVGAELRAELAAAQRTGALANAAAARPALQARLGQNFPEVDLANLHVARDTTSGNLELVRPASGTEALAPGRPRLQTFLDNLRRDEARAIDNIINANPGGIDDAAIAAQLNARPNAPARWTEAEIAAFREQANTARVLKTPHHTISVMDAPHVAYDPRYIQLANAPLVTPHGHTAAAGTSPWTIYGTRSARRPPGGIGPELDVPFVRTTDAAEDFARGTSTVMGRPLTPPPGGAWDPAYFRSPEFFEQLRLQGNTGVWINPHDPSQRLLFDAHFVAGHRWQTGETGARAIFGPTVDFAGRFEGEVGRTLLDRSLRTAGRAGARSDVGRELEQGAGDSMLQSFGGIAPDDMMESMIGGSDESADAMLPGTDEEQMAGMLPMETERSETASAMPMSMDMRMGMGAAALAGLPMFMMGGASMSGAGGGVLGGEEGPAAPPTPVLYSPQSLVSIREQRTVIAEAIEMVNAYIGETAAAEEHNRVAGDAAAALKERNAAQGEFAQAERDTVAGEQDKLAQAGSAQEHMSAENQRASSEGDRGQREADTVQAEGQDVSVEPKPEEPESKSWLERAWDATAGALWDNLIAPAVRAVRRKVAEVMQSINEFIMNMINQALGLDEIQAELDGGGQDIQARDASLGETDAGLQDTQTQATAEAERNQQSMDQADVNVADSAMMREDAQTLLAALVTHNELLESEEAAGTTYIVDFASTYQPFFAAEGEMSETTSESPESVPAEGMGADAMAMSEMPEMSMMPEPSLESEGMSETSAV